MQWKGGRSLAENENPVASSAEEVLKRYTNMVLRIAFQIVKTTAGAEEVGQEVFLKWQIRHPRFESLQQEKDYMVQLAINTSRNYLHTSWARYTGALTETFYEFTKEQLAAAEPLFRLPIHVRMALYLTVYEGYDAKRIASLLGTKEGNVAGWVERGKERMAAYLSPQGEEPCLYLQMLQRLLGGERYYQKVYKRVKKEEERQKNAMPMYRRVLAMAVSLLLVVGLCGIGYQFYLSISQRGKPSEPGASDTSNEPDMEEIPCLVYNGRKYLEVKYLKGFSLPSHFRGKIDAGDRLGVVDAGDFNGGAIYAYKPVETDAILVLRQGENYRLLGFYGYLHRNSSVTGEELMELFGDPADVVSIRLVRRDNQTKDFELLNQLTIAETEAFVRQFSEAEIYDPKKEEASGTSDGASGKGEVSEDLLRNGSSNLTDDAPRYEQQLLITFATGVTMTMNCDGWNLRGYNLTYQLTPELWSLLGR